VTAILVTTGWLTMVQRNLVTWPLSETVPEPRERRLLAGAGSDHSGVQLRAVERADR
jgi:hypothetical protein